VGCTATVCCLLLIYLAAYAQVTKLGIAQANMRLALRQERIENAILGAQYDWLRSPRRISDAAANFKMARDAERTVYITGAQPGPTVSDATVQADNDLPAIPVTITQVGTIAAGVRDVKLPGVSNGGIDSQTSHGAATAD
jgi:hydrogenase maturation factor HypE